MGSMIVDETKEGFPYVFEEGFLANILKESRRRYGVDGCKREGVFVKPSHRRNQMLEESVSQDDGACIPVEGYEGAMSRTIGEDQNHRE